MRTFAALLAGCALVTAGCSSSSGPPTLTAPTASPMPSVRGSAAPTQHGAATPTGARTSPSSTPAAATAQPAPTRSPQPLVGNADNGRTVHLVVGQRLRVRLDGAWTSPTASAPGVLRRESVKHRPQVARAVFVAAARGTSRLSARTTSGGSKTWQVRVIVS